MTGGTSVVLKLINEYGPIHSGIKKLSTGIEWLQFSTPMYVSECEIVKACVSLTPLDKVLVWFEKHVETSSMFSFIKK
jgi:hypothetical protein